MANKLIIAGAGSGKTTHIVRESLRITDKRTLVTTFTDANEREIIKKFYELNGCVPGHVVIQTWFSFLLEHGVKPFQFTDKRIRGVCLVSGQSTRYVPETDFDRYYLTKDYRVYSDKLSKLVVRCNEKSDGSVIRRISHIFPRIFIDEVQDMSGYDLELIKLFMESESSLLMVGDPRQTTYDTHKERKNSAYKNGKILEFIRDKCESGLCEIDCTSLQLNRRCNEMICRLSNQVFPEYPPCSWQQGARTGHDGVFMVRPSDVVKYLETFRPMQLRYSSQFRVNSEFPAINFGQAKGLTFDRVLIYPTDAIIKWLKNRNSPLECTTRSKLYVAITRAKYSAAIVMDFSDQTIVNGIEKYVFQN